MIYIVLFLISFTLTYFIKNYYIKNALLDEVNERSSHTVPTPHGGGIAIAITWFVGLVYLYYINEIDATLFYALMVGVVISVVSFFDDIYELSAKLRLVVQAGVAIVGLYLLSGVDALTFGIFEISNVFITNAFAILLIIWFINLTNFIDGINGYVGSEFFFLSIVLFCIVYFLSNLFIAFVIAILFLYGIMKFIDRKKAFQKN